LDGGRAGSCTLIAKQDANRRSGTGLAGIGALGRRRATCYNDAAKAIDILALITRGATWYGFLAGKDFS
jgi:hypothetical protein